MSFAVWPQKPPFTEADLTPGEKIYPVGNQWVVTDGPAPTQVQVDAVLASAKSSGETLTVDELAALLKAKNVVSDAELSAAAAAPVALAAPKL